MDDASPIKILLDTLPQVGRVEWIGVRPGRGEPMVAVEGVGVSPEGGLEGDRYDGRPGSKRQVTLIQHEHLPVIAGCLGWPAVLPAGASTDEKLRENLPGAETRTDEPPELSPFAGLPGFAKPPGVAKRPGDFPGELPGELPGVLRRNVVVSGVNLLALKGKTFRVGDAVLRWTGLCHPCSKMETALGPGGYNAMRGHGGITASVEAAGRFAVGDAVAMVASQMPGGVTE